MKESEKFDRIRHDLETIQGILGVDLPFTRQDVVLNIVFAGWGLLLMLWAAFGPWEKIRLIIIPLILMLIGFLWLGHRRKNKATTPISVRQEHRWGILFLLIVVPLLVGYLLFEIKLGLPRQWVGSGATFFIGIMLIAMAFFNRNRLYYLGGAIPLIVFGLIMPLCTPQHVAFLGGAVSFIAGIAMATIQKWQMRAAEDKYGPITD